MQPHHGLECPSHCVCAIRYGIVVFVAAGGKQNFLGRFQARSENGSDLACSIYACQGQLACSRFCSHSAAAFPAPTGAGPVEARFGNHVPPPATAFRPPAAVGSKGRRKGWGTRCVVTKPGSHRCRTGGEPDSYQTGLPPVQDRWGARSIQGNQSRNGDVYARKREIKPECDKLNTPGLTHSEHDVFSSFQRAAQRVCSPFVSELSIPGIVLEEVRSTGENKLNPFGDC